MFRAFGPLVAVAVTTLGPWPVQAQAGPVVPVERSEIYLEAPHSLVGVVFDVDSGDPLAGAIVRLVGSERATSSDSLGRFSLNLGGPGQFEIEVLFIGYQQSTIPVEVDSLESVALTVGLAPRPVEMCATLACTGPYGCDHVVVKVRDVLTGAAPKGEVTLQVSGADTVLAVSSLAGDGLGPLELGMEVRPHTPPWVAEVAAPGYRTWRSRQLRGPCGHVGQNEFFVWLVPIEAGGPGV